MQQSRFLLPYVLWCAAMPAYAQTSHPEVMVVYNSSYSDSLTVANHYLAARNIPGSNLCAIAPPRTDVLTLDDYSKYVKTPVQNCLTSLGRANVLYIVMSYLTPWGLSAGPMGTAALDSYLADVWDQYVNYSLFDVPFQTQPYYANSQSQGNVYAPFQSFASWRAGNSGPLIYDVWRLDGPSAAAASALVDQAIAAENAGGVHGQACLDRRYGDLTNALETGYLTGDFDLSQAAMFLRQAGVTVTEDSNNEEFGTAPAPLTCANTAFYSGWYSYYSYNDAFQWQTGSIGWHLDSDSAAFGPRSGGSWVAQALQRGIAVTTGSANEPYLQGLVRPGGAFRNLLEGASVGDAFLRNTAWLKWEVLYVGDPLYRPFGRGKAPFAPLQAVSSLAFSQQELVGGTAAAGTVNLAGAAPAGGITFSLTATAGAGATVPASVTVPAGATSASFPISTTAQTQSTGALITATSPGLTLKNTVTMDPLLGAFFSQPAVTMAGFPITAVLALNGPAPAGGATVALSSDNTALIPPATVTVPAGATYSTFTMQSSAVTTAVSPTLTGQYAGATATLAFSVAPAIQNVAITPSLVAAGGAVRIEVDSSIDAAATLVFQLSSDDPATLTVPASVTIPAGSHYAITSGNASAAASSKTVHVTVTGGGMSVTVPVQVQGTAIAVSVSPSSTSLSAGGTQSFTANTAVTWSISPQTGTISSSGVYTAPSTVAATQTVTVTATSTVDSTKSGSAIITLNPAATTFTPIRVNAGGASYTDSSGNAWSGDAGFSGGATWSVSSAISNTNAQALYQSCRYGNFSYNFPVPNGTYTVNLKFAEISAYGSGQRVFNAAINGSQALSNFDIFAQAGGMFIALDKQFTVNVTAGQIAIQFTAGAANLPMVSAIEITQGSYTPAAGALINSGGGAYTDASEQLWSADGYYSGGATWSVAHAIANTNSQALYQTCRYGVFTYSVPAPNGAYTLTLKFAEPSFSGAGQRVFNVTINGTAALTNFDIFAAAGGMYTAVDRSFPVNVTGGLIVIEFTSGAANLPMVNAIAIQPGATSYFVNAGGPRLTDSAGQSWSGDSNYSGGQTWSVMNVITNTGTPALYQTCRYGDFTYTFVEPNGNYNVVLKFAEPSRAGMGLRQFNVSINGSSVLTNFDVYAAAGGAYIALDRTFPVTLANGRIAIEFSTGAADLPMVSAIEVIPQ